jgi:DNA repair exonuclease SbcCD nuclease subunit
MKPFISVHASYLHLDYAQYNLDVRRRDFNLAFQEMLNQIIELKPDFMILAGDIFAILAPQTLPSKWL